MHDLSKLIGDYFTLFLAQNALGRAEPRGEQYEVLDRIRGLDKKLKKDFYSRIQEIRRDWKESNENSQRLEVWDIAIEYFERNFLNPQKTD
jgi:hypothetical protein